jgi:hypothetical protein
VENIFGPMRFRLIQVSLYLHFDRYMFRTSLAIFRRSIQHFNKLSHSQRVRRICVQVIVYVSGTNSRRLHKQDSEASNREFNNLVLD